jgi:hypothetical protein
MPQCALGFQDHGLHLRAGACPAQQPAAPHTPWPSQADDVCDSLDAAFERAARHRAGYLPLCEMVRFDRCGA